MRRDLERGLHPLLSLLPRYLFGSALIAQFVAVVVRLAALADIARGVLAAALIVGLVALTVLLVDYASAPVGSLACRLRGLASAGMSAMVVGFALAWNMLADGSSGGSVFVVEVVSFLGAFAVAREAARLRPESSYGFDDNGLDDNGLDDNGLDDNGLDGAEPDGWLLQRAS
jgi:hypothetical protein